MNRDVLRGAAAALLAAAAPVYGATTAVDMHAIDNEGVRERLGTVTATDSEKGLILDVQLRSIPDGEHGFHVHQNPDCGPKTEDGKSVAGGAAGGHYDPQRTGRHEGPFGDGHLGDLPAIHAVGGNVDARVIAPRLDLADIQGRALMVHAGGDNYADKPKPLGGGGARIACGVIR